MKKQIKINRRSFIKNTSTASGGLVLGLSFFTSCADQSSATVQCEWFDLNA